MFCENRSLAVNVRLYNVPALRMHPQMVISAAVKNLMGFLTYKERNIMHETGVPYGIWDLQSAINKTIGDQITIVDSLDFYDVFGGDKSLEKKPFLYGGTNPLAVDIVSSYLVGIDEPIILPHIKAAESLGLPIFPIGECISESILRNYRFDAPLLPRIDCCKIEGIEIIWGEFEYPANGTLYYDLIQKMQTEGEELYKLKETMFQKHNNRFPLTIFVGAGAGVQKFEDRYTMAIAIPSPLLRSDSMLCPEFARDGDSHLWN